MPICCHTVEQFGTVVGKKMNPMQNILLELCPTLCFPHTPGKIETTRFVLQANKSGSCGITMAIM